MSLPTGRLFATTGRLGDVAVHTVTPGSVAGMGDYSRWTVPAQALSPALHLRLSPAAPCYSAIPRHPTPPHATSRHLRPTSRHLPQALSHAPAASPSYHPYQALSHGMPTRTAALSWARGGATASSNALVGACDTKVCTLHPLPRYTPIHMPHPVPCYTPYHAAAPHHAAPPHPATHPYPATPLPSPSCARSASGASRATGCPWPPKVRLRV